MNYLKTKEEKIIEQIYNGTIKFIDLSKDLKRNRQIVTAAIIYDPNNINNVNTSFLDDYNVMLKVLSNHGYLIDYIPSIDLFEDYNIVLAAVTNDGMILQKIYNYEIIYEDIYEREGRHYHNFIERKISISVLDRKE